MNFQIYHRHLQDKTQAADMKLRIPPSSDEEDEDPVAFLILLAVLAAIQLKHTTPKPVMRPWSSLTKRR